MFYEPQQSINTSTKYFHYCQSKTSIKTDFNFAKESQGIHQTKEKKKKKNVKIFPLILLEINHKIPVHKKMHSCILLLKKHF